MKDGAEVLNMLRYQSGVAIRAWGFVTRGHALHDAYGGLCTLTCGRYRESSVYEIMVDASQGSDWYIPFLDNEARYCDVPLNQKDGTLVVTHPMNGCALEVHATENGNRFYHDSDGKSMPNNLGKPKFRIEYADYAKYKEYVTSFDGKSVSKEPVIHESAKEINERYAGRGDEDTHYAGGFEHNVFCVKKGGNWNVYASAVVLLTTVYLKKGGSLRDGWQIKQYIPYEVGSFSDA